jgi:hypothetical protein
MQSAGAKLQSGPLQKGGEGRREGMQAAAPSPDIPPQTYSMAHALDPMSPVPFFDVKALSLSFSGCVGPDPDNARCLGGPREISVVRLALLPPLQ